LKKHQDEYKLPEIAELIHRMRTIPNAINYLFKTILDNCLPQLITLVIVVVYLFFVNPLLGFSCLILFFVYFLITYKIFNQCKKIAIYNETLNERNQSILTDKFQNLFSIYSNGKLYDEIKENQELTEEFKNITRENMECNNKIKTFNLYYNLIVILSIITLAVILYRKNKISHVVLVSVILIVSYVPDKMRSVGYGIPSITNNYSVIKKNKTFINDVWDIQPQKENKLVLTDGKISIKNITFGYPDRENIFTDFSLEIAPKEKIAILGTSGLGKSTLVKLITGYYQLKSGSILIDNTDISTVNLNDLRKNITYVSQNNILFNKSILENIRYSNDKSREYIVDLINRLGIFQNIDLDQNVGITGDKLSGGQKQLIHILRAICKNNKIVILDEPTSSIDVDSKANIITAIKEINATLILITHDETILGLVDKKLNIN